jgi:hypothetical protein
MASSSLLQSPPSKHGPKVDEWEHSVNKTKKYQRKELFSLVSSFLMNQCPPKTAISKGKVAVYISFAVLVARGVERVLSQSDVLSVTVIIQW